MDRMLLAGARRASCEIAAPAKINLYLRVVRRRRDGYHDLDSWMHKIALCDRLTVSLRPTPGLTLTVSDKHLPGDATNLVWRAASAFFATCGLSDTVGADIVLEKNIPVAAGLGGGSSDAAATLSALNRLCGLPLTASGLSELGLSLGADVPFFLFDAPSAFASGIGEILRPAPLLAGYHLVLVNPGFPVSTRETFSRLSLTEKTKKIKKASPVGREGDEDINGFDNDLEAVTMAMHPEIARIKERLLFLGAATALMSGSGATVFGLFARRNFLSLTRVEENLRQEFGPLVFVTNLLTGA
ncbi:MAG TPA: 4-(cytidine 5'-diphospho)-2-C-methyl-D-erythritol kinase [Desulfobulbaceae bacterium]|nr:4-(cytidine 5'-diphospho)-2-C-methyl-D-erythritol kinase [Desulfobulbaceae bacterium]